MSATLPTPFAANVTNPFPWRPRSSLCALCTPFPAVAFTVLRSGPLPMNYFNYFTEIEQRFQQRRGSILMLSTLDWALIETWREGGIPLEAVLRGIDHAFDKHDAKKASSSRAQRKINGLTWAAQSVLQAAGEAAEAAIGTNTSKAELESGFEATPVIAWLTENATKVARIDPAIAERLRELTSQPLPMLEDLDRILTVLEEKLFANLLVAAPEQELVDLRTQADRELAPYRSKLGAVQIRQIQQQFLQKRLLEARNLPRLSLFYMPHH